MDKSSCVLGWSTGMITVNVTSMGIEDGSTARLQMFGSWVL
jgi:hypothetical protein